MKILCARRVCSLNSEIQIFVFALQLKPTNHVSSNRLTANQLPLLFILKYLNVILDQSLKITD